MAKKSFDIDRLRALRAELGTKEVARRMGIPQPSLRRILSTKKISPRMIQRASVALIIPSRTIPKPIKARRRFAEEVETTSARRATVDTSIDIYDLADAMGVDAENLAEDLGIDIEDDFWDAFDLQEDPDVFDELADILDIDVSDIYDMYYGYAPGSHGR